MAFEWYLRTRNVVRRFQKEIRGLRKFTPLSFPRNAVFLFFPQTSALFIHFARSSYLSSLLPLCGKKVSSPSLKNYFFSDFFNTHSKVLEISHLIFLRFLAFFLPTRTHKKGGACLLMMAVPSGLLSNRLFRPPPPALAGGRASVRPPSLGPFPSRSGNVLFSPPLSRALTPLAAASPTV